MTPKLMDYTRNFKQFLQLSPFTTHSHTPEMP